MPNVRYGDAGVDWLSARHDHGPRHRGEDAASRAWPRRARLACLALTGEEPDEGRIGTRLLADLKLIWADDEEGLHTDTITDRLHKLEEAPWKGWVRDGRRSLLGGWPTY